jgi:acetyl esterase/lipase
VLAGQLLLSPSFTLGPASPLLAPSLAGVAPATVVTAENDPAGEDGRRYAARLRAAGVEVEEVSSRHLWEARGMRFPTDGYGPSVAGTV